MKSKQLELELVKIKHANHRSKTQSELKELNKVQFVSQKIHEGKNEVLVDCSGEFEMVCILKVGDQYRQIHNSFRNITAYEAYINFFDEGSDAEDAIFNEYIFKINTPLFNIVSRS